MMRRAIFCAMAAWVVGAMAPAGALAACGDLIRYEPNARLSVAAISKLAEQQNSILATPNGGWISFWPFDHEDHPFKGDWAAMAIVFAGDGNPGDQPGGVIWANFKRLPIVPTASAAFGKRGTAVSLTVSLDSGPEACRRLTFTFSDKGVLSLDGARVGLFQP